MNENRRCGATNRSGNPCGRAAAPGATVCDKHGARAPQVREAARLRVIDERARAALAKLDLSGAESIDPVTAMLAEISRSHALVQWLTQQVQELDESNLVWNQVRRQEGRGPQGAVNLSEFAAEPSVWWRLLAEERDRLVRVSAAAIKCGIEARRIALAERQGEVLVTVIRSVLAAPELGLDGPRRAAAEAIAHRALLAAAAGEGAA